MLTNYNYWMRSERLNDKCKNWNLAVSDANDAVLFTDDPLTAWR